MFGDKDISPDLPCEGDNSQTNLSHRRIAEDNSDKVGEKMGFSQKGIDFIRASQMGRDAFPPNLLKPGSSGSQELTLSYLCDNTKLGFCDSDFNAKIAITSLERLSQKGKEVLVSENFNHDDKCVERDFLNLNQSRGNSSKREAEEEIEEKVSHGEKRPKLETLNLSLALPDVSLSLTASNALQNADPVLKPMPSSARSIQSMAPSTNNTQTTCSNDFPATSFSYSYSHPFSHNPSCSLTRNSTDYYECSVGRDDQTWCGGEGTNGSVHSRFKPIGDGVALSNHGGGNGGGGFSTMQRNKDSCNSLYKTTSSDNYSFFPSELPARLRVDNLSGDSRRRDSENLRGAEGVDGGRGRKLSRPERILHEIVSESIPVMALLIQEIPEETLESTKEYLRNLIGSPEKKDELVGLQIQLEKRSDFTKETLSKCHKDQLDILVAVRTGLKTFVSGKIRVPAIELVEIFFFLRCKNVNCNSLLPVDDCDCKICTANKGFCSSCMCPVCLTFDCASNTCSWVGCDVCSHWCHAACGIQKNLIKPGPSLKAPSGTTEVQFHCIGCGHASEMFGFVKDVFMCCAQDWGLETLIKELDCVRKIFRSNDDFKSKELHIKADELVTKLENKIMTPSDACKFIIKFFNYADCMPDFPVSGVSSKEVMPPQSMLRKDEGSVTPATSLSQKYSIYSTSSSSGRRDLLSNDLLQKDLKTSLPSDPKLEDEMQFGRSLKNDGFDSLESIVRIKEAEARMFQNKADEARREAERFIRMIRAKADKLDEEYAEKLGKLCLQETEERRRKKLEELKVLEHSQCDYKNMKFRMQAEIAGLLERMEATKQQWV